MKKRIAVIAAAVLAVLVLSAGVLFWYWMSKPLYEPGMVRAGQNLRAPLKPPFVRAEPAVGEQFWTVETDIRLRHFSDGTGPNVLVIHGGPGYPFAAPLPGLQALTSGYRLVYYDQRGAGRSTRPIDRFSSSNYYENMLALDQALGLGAQIADIERIRQILGQDKLILVGHSFGGFLAALYAAEFPEHVQSLVLVAPADLLVMPPQDGGLFEQLRPLLPESMRSEYADFLKRYLDYGAIFSKSDADLVALNREFEKYYGVVAQAKGWTVSSSTRPEAVGGWMVHAMYLSMGTRHDYRAALKNVTAPVLVLHGENDLQPEQASRVYADAFPHATFRVVKNAGHFIFADQPDEFAGTVREFLDGAR